MKGVQNVLRKEECARGTGQTSDYAALKDAPTSFRKEEYALDTVQTSDDAAVKDVQIILNVEECARSMGRIAIHKTNLLHLDQSSR